MDVWVRKFAWIFCISLIAGRERSLVFGMLGIHPPIKQFVHFCRRLFYGDFVCDENLKKNVIETEDGKDSPGMRISLPGR